MGNASAFLKLSSRAQRSEAPDTRAFLRRDEALTTSTFPRTYPAPQTRLNKTVLERRFFITPRQIGEKDNLRSCHPENIFRELGCHSST